MSKDYRNFANYGTKKRGGWKKSLTDIEKAYRFILRVFILIGGGVYFYKQLFPKIKILVLEYSRLKNTIYLLAVGIETIFFVIFLVAFLLILEIAIRRRA